MRISDIRNILKAKVLCGEGRMSEDITTAYACDMMSDVLAWPEDIQFLLTGLVNAQVIRTADMVDIGLILFVQNKTPTEDVINMAIERDMVLMVTGHTLYTSCALLYQGGLVLKN